VHAQLDITIIGAHYESLALATKSWWMTAKLYSSLLKHTWQQSHCSQHNSFCCYFKTTWVTSPLYQLWLLKVTAIQSSLFHCTVPPTTAIRSYSFWTSEWCDNSAVNFNFKLSTLIAFQKIHNEWTKVNSHLQYSCFPQHLSFKFNSNTLCGFAKPGTYLFNQMVSTEDFLCSYASDRPNLNMKSTDEPPINRESD
jgi:hypothetical protein